MKRFLFFLLILPLLSHAKFYPGTVHFTDGSSKSGFIEIPDYFQASSIEFKAAEGGKSEKFETENINGFNITIDGVELEYKALILAMPKLFSKELDIDKKKSWMRVEAKGTIEMLSCSDPRASSPSGPFHGSMGSTTYFIVWPGNDYALYFYPIFRGPGITVSNEYKSLMKMTKHYFGEKCPLLLTDFSKEIYKEQGVPGIAEYYNKNCAKP